MIKAIWFAVKIAVLVALAVWVADQPGSVRVESGAYIFNIQLGFFLACLLGVVAASIFIYQVIKTFVDFPKSLARYNQIKAREQGYIALTRGLTAVAAGDTKSAARYSKKANDLLAGDTGLPLLLEAQTARLEGREEDAAQSFVALLEDENASFLGVRGLLQSALDGGDDEAALGLAEKALALHPKQGWILKIAYDLQIRMRKFFAADKTLAKMEKAGVVSASDAQSDRVALMLEQADKDLDEGFEADAMLSVKKARKIAPDFPAPAMMLADFYKRENKLAKARDVIKKAWKASPHGALVPVWMDVMDDGAAGDKLLRLKWIQRLLKINPENATVQRMTGDAAMDAGLWGEAREYFERAEDIAPSTALYQSLAKLAEKSGGSDESVRAYLEKAAHAPSEKVWVCRESGNIYSRWSPIAQPHGSFNTIIWDVPHAHRGPVILLNETAEMAEALIEAPDNKSSKPESDAA